MARRPAWSPPASVVWDGKKFKKLRERAGLDQIEITRLIGIAVSTLIDYEKSVSAPSAYHLHVLCKLYKIDPLELGELLRLDYVGPGELRSFRSACAQEGKLPIEVIRDFVRVYPQIVRQKNAGE